MSIPSVPDKSNGQVSIPAPSIDVRVAPSPRRARSLMELRHAATDRLTIVDVPDRRLYVVDGRGDPYAADFEAAGVVLRAAAVELRAMCNTGSRLNVEKIGVLECLWWHEPPLPIEDVPRSFEARLDWHWRQMIEIPARATDEEAETALDRARRRAGRRMRFVRVAPLSEGMCVQILHVGTTRTEAAALERLYAALGEAELRPRGEIHTLRVADERDVPPGRARSIVRVPIDAPV